MSPTILDMKNALIYEKNAHFFFFQSSAKDRMTYFNFSITIKQCRYNDKQRKWTSVQSVKKIQSATIFLSKI